MPSVFSSPGLLGTFQSLRPRWGLGGEALRYRAREHLFYPRCSVKAAMDGDSPWMEVMCVPGQLTAGSSLPASASDRSPFHVEGLPLTAATTQGSPQHCLQPTQPQTQAGPSRACSQRDRAGRSHKRPGLPERNARTPLPPSGEERRAPRFSERKEPGGCLGLFEGGGGLNCVSPRFSQSRNYCLFQ